MLRPLHRNRLRHRPATRGATAKTIAKRLLVHTGAASSGRTIYNLNGAFNYLHVGWWLRSHGFEPGEFFPSRYELFDRIAAEIGGRETLYLEFGVAQGVSMSYWAGLLANPASHLHGFDSFLGLPHDWSLEGHGRGYFSTGGSLPSIDDPRVELFPGWFDETFPQYVWPDHDALVCMLDADLYASTVAVLDFVKGHLGKGSYLYFDQFHHRSDELRAFSEFLDENPMTFRLMGATHEFSCVAFQRVS